MEKYICHKCGSDNILIRAWIDPKDNTIESWDETDCYCHECGEITEYDIKTLNP